MTKILQLAVMTAALVGSASLAMAQDGRTRDETWRNYNDAEGYNAEGYNANGSMKNGPYVAPRHLRTQPGAPFTWQEKRYFDWSTGEQG
jgi:hypothetical protein